MNQNHAFSASGIGLPEDIQHLKETGQFDHAIRLIDQRLSGELPQCMRRNLEAHREIIARTAKEFRYTKEAGLARVQEKIPDFTMEELEHYMDNGRATWHYVDGQPYLTNSFLGTLHKESEIAARLPQEPQDSQKLSHEQMDRSQRLNHAITIMQEKGSMSARIVHRHTIRIKDKAFVPGETYRIWIPLPAKCLQQSDIQVLATSSEPTSISPEDAGQRTIYWEETMTENHPFWVEYSYRHTAPYVDPSKVQADPVQPDFDTQEIPPHIVFTPYIKALCAELTQGVTDPIEKARRFYHYITTQVKYSFVPDYFVLTDIADTCLRTLRGDCGVQALAFITLCRCAGIPAKWQSGLVAEPGNIGCHDWAMFYAAPYGWMFADPSFGGSAYRAGSQLRHNHYFGNLDVYRMVTANEFQADFQPQSRFWRQDPYDNQVGEVEDSKRGYYRYEVEHDLTAVSFEEES